jgi:hypothetical protein
MATVRLEFESLTMDRPKKRWNLYFVLLTEHPTDEDKMVMRVFPEQPISLLPAAQNEIDFSPEGQHTNGLIVLERTLPTDKTLRAQVFLRHSRDDAREIGEVIASIQAELGDNVLGAISDIFNVAGPWMVIAKTAFGIVGDILRKVQDRDFGFLSLDQHFTEEFMDNVEYDRKHPFSTHHASLVWTWSVDR